MKAPTPTHREAIALFRLGVIGDLVAMELESGELKDTFVRRSLRRYRAPGSSRTRTYHWKTLQRWYYTAKSANPEALEPASRSRGFALALNPEQREILLDIRRLHPTAAASLILDQVIEHGVVEKKQVSVSTVRRLFAEADLPRQSRKRADRVDVQRRRWQAAQPGDLWHGDVCHLIFPSDKGRRRVLVHGLMDDNSRYFTALKARTREREQDMLEVFCGALLRYPPPKTLYLDNGSCYRGDTLALLCKRLGIRLIHAAPYDPQARGKMERAWRTMRQRCTDYLPGESDIHQVDQALWAWLDADYHRRPHAGLMGETPRRQYLESLPRQGTVLTPKTLAKALEVSSRRQIRRDGTFDVGGVTYEVAGRHLMGKRIDLVIDGMTELPIQASYQGQTVRFGPCDPVINSRRKSSPSQPSKSKEPDVAAPFDPIATLLAKAREVSDE